MGWIGDDVLHSLYAIADLCVVPSIYEPFGLVALEAMASGCPCIVADTGGLREVVPNEDVGLRFRSRDPRSLARMVERVLTDDALRARPDRRGLRARPALRLGRRRPPHREVYDDLAPRGAQRGPGDAREHAIAQTASPRGKRRPAAPGRAAPALAWSITVAGEQ